MISACHEDLVVESQSSDTLQGQRERLLLLPGQTSLRQDLSGGERGTVGAAASHDEDNSSLLGLILSTAGSEPGLEHVRQCLGLALPVVPRDLPQVSGGARVASYNHYGALLLYSTCSSTQRITDSRGQKLFSPEFPVEIEAGLKGSVVFQ